MEGIKNLIIDFGGVLISLTRTRCVDEFERIGISRMKEPIMQGFKPKDLFTLFEEGLISPEVFRYGVRQFGTKPVTDQQIDDAWNAMLGVVPEEYPALLERLRAKYNTMILSNTNSIHWEYAEKRYFSREGFTMNDCFNHVYLSYQLKLVKPDIEIFKQVLQDAQIRPEETLFIDDSPVNCKAAQTLGIRTMTPQPRENWILPLL